MLCVDSACVCAVNSRGCLQKASLVRAVPTYPSLFVPRRPQDQPKATTNSTESKTNTHLKTKATKHGHQTRHATHRVPFMKRTILFPWTSSSILARAAASYWGSPSSSPSAAAHRGRGRTPDSGVWWRLKLLLVIAAGRDCCVVWGGGDCDGRWMPSENGHALPLPAHTMPCVHAIRLEKRAR